MEHFLCLLIFLFHLLLLLYNVIRKSFCFPTLLKEVLQNLTFHKGNLLFDFTQEIKFFTLFISSSNLVLDDDFNFFVS